MNCSKCKRTGPLINRAERWEDPICERCFRKENLIGNIALGLMILCLIALLMAILYKGGR